MAIFRKAGKICLFCQKIGSPGNMYAQWQNSPHHSKQPRAKPAVSDAQPCATPSVPPWAVSAQHGQFLSLLRVNGGFCTAQAALY